MKVKLLKPCKYAFHPAFGPQVSFKKDQEFGTTKAAIDTNGNKFTPSVEECQVLIDIGYAELIEGSENDVKDEETSEIQEETSEEPSDDESSEDEEEKPLIEDLMKKLEIVEDNNEKKSIIEDWATVNLGIDLDRRKSVKKMLEVVQKNL